jgi:hypothetical protein
LQGCGWRMLIVSPSLPVDRCLCLKQHDDTKAAPGLTKMDQGSDGHCTRCNGMVRIYMGTALMQWYMIRISWGHCTTAICNGQESDRVLHYRNGEDAMGQKAYFVSLSCSLMGTALHFNGVKDLIYGPCTAMVSRILFMCSALQW